MSGDIPPLKKQPSHCRRGLAARLAAKNKNVTEDKSSTEISGESAVYSTQVARMLNKRGLPDVEHFHCVLSGEDSNDEDEDDCITPSKKAKPKSDTRNTAEVCSLLSDDEEEIHCTPPDRQPIVVDSLRSPSPPPPPEPLDVIPVLTKQPSMTRAMKKAMKQLSEAKSYLQRDTTALNMSYGDDVICLDDSLDENSVFFFVQCNAELQKHRMGKLEPFKNLVDHLAVEQNISAADVMLSLNDVTIRPSDTPLSVNLKSANIIMMYKKSVKDSCEPDSSDLSGIQLFVQSRNSKKKLDFKIDPLAPLQLLINKYCIKTKNDPGKYRLQFDGEDVHPQDTATDLELEEGYCLDIIEIT
ncbi:NFATC2-interacting protein-like isoform X2 [Saccostrea cucullata]|uniref:NFATC2-interacting protein-like isoform X2 n=1 Tax=Saccostrea cuccullata TaxID=36930 RepID=UPI002ED4E7AE